MFRIRPRRSPSAAGSLEAAVEALDRGECVAIFPEGTISLDLDPKKLDIPLGNLPKPPKLPSIGGFELGRGVALAGAGAAVEPAQLCEQG